MSQQVYIFEQPLNERIRMFLRIEHLVDRLQYLKGLDTDTGSYQALLTVLEITSLVERGDIKQEVIKELERQHRSLNQLISHQGVDKSRLELTLSKLKTAMKTIRSLDGKLGEHLKKIDYLLSIKQRASIPGGSCDFDIPQLRYWLNQPFAARTADIDRWSKPYSELYEVLVLILNILRDSAHAEMTTAVKGFFQEPLDTSQPNQLLRIEMPHGSDIFPEISAGKHRYSIRFLQAQDSVDRLPVQYKQDITFRLFRCTL
jgi:cell division protein ZapD